jgi:murein DD-endopeptidase MepM/ murein hydrolase activator NlpD
MIRTLITVAVAGATGFAGWLGGSIFPAPPAWTDTINRQANDLRARVSLDRIDLDGLKRMIPQAKLDQLTAQATQAAVASGQAIEVDTNSGTLEEQLDNLAISPEQAMAASAPPPPAVGAPAGTPASVFDASLILCPRMEVSNAPAADAQRKLAPYNPFVSVQGVRIATDPARGACLSSGYGTRDARLHKGVDYHSETGGPIVAAADGTVIEMKYRDDYGNMVLIDHGHGVYTRYAHLASFGRGLTAGVTVKAGEQIGLMGNTAAYPVPIHLHYEVLTGNYANPRQSFGLQPVDVFMMQPAR